MNVKALISVVLILVLLFSGSVVLAQEPTSTPEATPESSEVVGDNVTVVVSDPVTDSETTVDVEADEVVIEIPETSPLDNLIAWLTSLLVVIGGWAVLAYTTFEKIVKPLLDKAVQYFAVPLELRNWVIVLGIIFAAAYTVYDLGLDIISESPYPMLNALPDALTMPITVGVLAAGAFFIHWNAKRVDNKVEQSETQITITKE